MDRSEYEPKWHEDSHLKPNFNLSINHVTTTSARVRGAALTLAQILRNGVFKQPSLDLHNTVTNIHFIFIQYYEEKVRA